MPTAWRFCCCDPREAFRMALTTATPAELRAALLAEGFAFVRGDAARDLIAAHGSLSDWPTFAASWTELQLDTYMADGGRYRRRRHATYRVTADAIQRKPHEPHYQSLEYNPL